MSLIFLCLIHDNRSHESDCGWTLSANDTFVSANEQLGAFLRLIFVLVCSMAHGYFLLHALRYICGTTKNGLRLHLELNKKRYTTIALHVSIWALVLILQYVPFLNSGNFAVEMPDVFMLLPIINLCSFSLIFYLNYYLLLPKLLLKKNGWIYLGSSIVIMIVFIYTQVTIRQNLFQEFRLSFPHPSMMRRVGGFIVILLHLITWMISSGLWFLTKWKQSEERLQESEHKRTIVELEQLKKQINPHFLFNTLNSIYALALMKKNKTADAILKLSKLMRYVLTDANKDFVDLNMDIAHIEHFVELNRLRLTDKNPLYYQKDIPANAYKIAPLLLLGFVENAFKFGISSVEQTPIWIQLTLEGNTLHFYCKNKVKTNTEQQKTGIGIQNTQRRLELIYPHQHQLTITNDPYYFIVELSITLREKNKPERL